MPAKTNPKEPNLDLIQEINHFRQLCVEEPNQAENHFHLGSLLFENQEYNQAIYAFKKATALNPTWVEADLKIGQSFQWLGFPLRAINTYESLLAKNPQNQAALHALGRLYSEAGDFENSKFYFQQALSYHPKDHLARRQLTLIAFADQDYNQMLELAKMGIDEEKPQAEDWHQYGLALSKIKNFNEAKIAFEKALEGMKTENLPPSAALFSNYAFCLGALGEKNRAEDYYAEAVELEKENPDLWFNYGEFLLENQKKEEAFHAFQQSIKRNPTDGESWFCLAQCFGLENPMDAEKCLQKARDLKFQSGQMQIFTAELFEHLNRPQEAFDYRKKAQLKIPTHNANNTAIGLTFLKQGQHQEAWENLKRVHPIEKKDVELWVRIAQNYRNAGFFDQELACLEKLSKLEQAPNYLWYRSAEIATEKGFTEEMHHYFEKVSQKLPFLPAIRFQFARNLKKGGKSIEAIFDAFLPSFFASKHWPYRFLGKFFSHQEEQKASYFQKEKWQNPDLHLSLGMHAWACSLFQKGRKEEGEKLTRYLLEKNSFPALSLSNLSEMMVSQDQPYELFSLLKDFILQRGENAHTLALLGFAEMHGNQIETAKMNLNKALELEKNHSLAWQLKTELHLHFEEWEEAKKAAHYLLLLNPSDPYNSFLNAKAHISSQEQALFFLKQALTKDHRYSPAWEFLGDLANQNTQWKKAKWCYLRAYSQNQTKSLFEKLANVRSKLQTS